MHHVLRYSQPGDTLTIMRKHITLFWRLSRPYLYLPLCFLAVLAGMRLVPAAFWWPDYVALSLASSLMLAASFAFNDLEDAADDLRGEVRRNPLAAGELSEKGVYRFAVLSGLTAITLAALVSWWSAACVVGVGLGSWLYSWRPVRLKTLPLAGLGVHGLVACLVFLSGGLFAGPLPVGLGMWGMGLLFFLGSAASLLFHQIMDAEVDRRVGVPTAAAAWGVRAAWWVNVGLWVGMLLLTLLLAGEPYFPSFPVTLFLGGTSLSLLTAAGWNHWQQSATLPFGREAMRRAVLVGTLAGLVGWII